MKPAEESAHMEQFRTEVARLNGDNLLDKWIAFDESPESKVPDLGIQKSLILEASLVAEFGYDWYKAVASRRDAKNANGS